MIKIKNKTKNIVVGFFINILMIFVWIFFQYLFGSRHDSWAFIDFILPFIGIYFLIILTINYRISKLKDKLLFSYVSCILPLFLSIFLVISSPERATIFLFVIFLIGPTIISYLSKFLILNRKVNRK